MTQYSARELRDPVHREQLKLAERELEVALLFANLSLAAYSKGRLRSATDARTKAELAWSRAAARLTVLEVEDPEVGGVRSMLGIVEGALTRLPISGELRVRVWRAAG
jgi:hypothetical protein